MRDPAKRDRERVYVSYAPRVDTSPHSRHGRELDTAERVPIRRPLDSTPRRADDWR